jgi:hypothetical protein
MAFDLELCEAVYEALGRDENLRAYRAYLRHRAWQLVQNSLDGDEIGLACKRVGGTSHRRYRTRCRGEQGDGEAGSHDPPRQ